MRLEAFGVLGSCEDVESRILGLLKDVEFWNDKSQCVALYDLGHKF